MAFREISVNQTSSSYALAIPLADSPVYQIPEAAVKLVILHRSKSAAQVPLRLRTGVSNEIDL